MVLNAQLVDIAPVLYFNVLPNATHFILGAPLTYVPMLKICSIYIREHHSNKNLLTLVLCWYYIICALKRIKKRKKNYY